MSDKIAESLSALLDNEATELDVRRLTKTMTDEDLDTWARMCAMKQGLHKENVSHQSINILDGIRAGIADEEIVAQPKPAASGWKNWLGGAGVAAAVALAVVGIGVQNNDFGSEAGGQLVTNDQPVATEKSEPAADVGETRLAAGDMSPEQYKALQDKLRSYMQQHAENSPDDLVGDVMPYARVVSFEVEQAKQAEK
ncbi:sigma-E factor negative regulatory protein [Litoribacillus peritrichatus]|uniref:Anti sigma-E factor RseA C-terminal domain-containing protein n=1 Tax=Litoribacillus peritrichatus TaxID=718191 RepID=A0ABP7MYR3_9GAMM